ncbi:MAG: hypothetical protein E8D49_00470 [Nitrospira sp.]|nr:MAG: hypothetical protein E8D49_00470 [Nitrospira sp.]
MGTRGSFQGNLVVKPSVPGQRRRQVRVVAQRGAAIDPEEVINPNHPNLTIWRNKIEVALFIGIHCHYANLALRMVRAGTNCLTIAYCHDIHEDAMLSVQEVDPKKMDHVIDIFRTVRKELGIEMPKDGKNVRLTDTQIRANPGVERGNPRPA